MSLTLHPDAESFWTATEPTLLANEPGYCVTIGNMSTHRREAERAAGLFFASFENGFAFWNQKTIYPLQLSRSDEPAIRAVIGVLMDKNYKIPGVLAELKTAERFRDLWYEAAGAKPSRFMRQGVFRCSSVTRPSEAKHLRLATESDRSLLRKWNLAFLQDCGIAHEADTEEIRETIIDRLVETKSRYLWLAPDGAPVSMAGVQGKTPNGIRVSWVYTPPELRGRGYASQVTAAVTQKMFDDGNKLCFLYTDLANPTSNSIYQKIGYERVWESAHFQFTY